MTPTPRPLTRDELRDRFGDDASGILSGTAHGNRWRLEMASGFTADLPADPRALAPLIDWLSEESERGRAARAEVLAEECRR